MYVRTIHTYITYVHYIHIYISTYVHWVKVNVGTYGNELADQLAKSSSTKQGYFDLLQQDL